MCNPEAAPHEVDQALRSLVHRLASCSGSRRLVAARRLVGELTDQQALELAAAANLRNARIARTPGFHDTLAGHARKALMYWLEQDARES